MASTIEIVTLKLADTNTEFVLPLKALSSSNVLERMAHSTMQEGQTKVIDLHDASPFALRLYMDISYLLFTKNQNTSTVKASSSTNAIEISSDDEIPDEYDLPETFFKMKGLSPAEMKACCTFWDKYDVSEHLWSFLKNNITDTYQGFKITLKNFTYYDSLRETVWKPSVYHTVAHALADLPNATEVCSYTEQFSKTSLQKILGTMTTHCRDEKTRKDRDAKDYDERIDKLEEEIEKLNKELRTTPNKRQKRK
jgi:hypothetical protein